MNLTHLEGMRLTQALAHELAGHDFSRVEVVLCPPFTALRTLQTLIDSDRYEFGLGAQNLYPRADGAFTGEISPVMLQALRVSYVIVGHSERRELLGESDAEVNSKVKAALAHDLTAIMCCGETEAERSAHETEAKVTRQVTAGLEGIDRSQLAKVVIAYEPIWAIGTGATATPTDAQETISVIRSVLRERFGVEVSDGVRILYGGSVKAGNAAALTSQPDVDGALVGGASLDAGEFASIVKATKS
jgi:triosephosphate isomerase (TIM)